jgi:type IX secretion system PorP/SprF family membrane protein
VKKRLLFVVANCQLLLANFCSAQEALNRSYPFNPLAVNPAYAGSREVTSLSLLLRRRSLVLQNTYTSQLFSMDFPVAQGRGGGGLQIFNDPYNAAGTLGVYGSGAYRIPLETLGGTLALGAQVGFTQTVAPNNIYGNNQYPFTLSLGLFYRTERFYAGLAQQNLAGRTDSYGTPLRPLFLTAGYLFDLSDDVKLRLGTLLRGQREPLATSGFKLAVDLNGTLWYRKVGVGLWYQGTGSEVNADNALLGTLEAQVGDRLRFGLSYDFIAGQNRYQTTPLGTAAGASSIFQLLLRYEFDNGSGKVGQMRYF